MNTPPRDLRIDTAFGPSLAAGKIIACQRDEWEDQGGQQRSFVLELRGDRAVIVETLDKPAYKSWRSDGGTAYCTSNDGELWVHDQGRWTRERVTAERVRLDKIWGFSGAAAAQDVLLVTSNAALHVRSAGTWQTHTLPEQVEMVSGLHGLTANEVYFATDYGLWLWNGEALSAVEGPMEDLRGVRVVSDDEMFATGDLIHRWTKAEGWTTLDSDLRLTIAIAKLGDDVLIGTRTGIVRVHGEDIKQETDVSCNLLARLGDDLVASGEKPLVYTQGVWTPISMPALSRNQTP